MTEQFQPLTECHINLTPHELLPLNAEAANLTHNLFPYASNLDEFYTQLQTQPRQDHPLLESIARLQVLHHGLTHLDYSLGSADDQIFKHHIDTSFHNTLFYLSHQAYVFAKESFMTYPQIPPTQIIIGQLTQVIPTAIHRLRTQRTTSDQLTFTLPDQSGQPVTYTI